MPDIDDDQLRDEVNNALEGDEDSSDDAENDQDNIDEDDNPDGNHDEEDGDAQDDDSGDDDSGKSNDRSAPADGEDSEDDDDDPAIDYAKPDFTPATAVKIEEFDIRTLPKDANGYIDPQEANRLINEYYAKQGTSQQEAQQREAQTKNLLTQQWTRVSKQYKEVYSNPRLRDMARDLHLNSIGTENYLTPAQAASKIERTRREIAKSGYKSAKTRRSVEKMTGTERNSGRSSEVKATGYEKARKLASSHDPNKAKAGRVEMIKLRRQARNRK